MPRQGGGKPDQKKNDFNVHLVHHRYTGRGKMQHIFICSAFVTSPKKIQLYPFYFTEASILRAKKHTFLGRRKNVTSTGWKIYLGISPSINFSGQILSLVVPTKISARNLSLATFVGYGVPPHGMDLPPDVLIFF